VPQPAILFCVGATKAGTSWLFRMLADHPDCALRSVKEAHYWDTFDPDVRARQVQAFGRRLSGLQHKRSLAAANGVAWQVASLDRQIVDLTALIGVLEGDRAGDAAYKAWLSVDGGTRLTGDLTPGYATLSRDSFVRMAGLSGVVRFVYLIRDPLARLWSHVRMQAERQRQPHETFEEKANSTLWRILHRGQETHILQRGDYPATVARLRAAVPATMLRVEYCERLFTESGLRDMCAFLGIRFPETAAPKVVHEGPKAIMRPELAPVAVRFLKEHYDWAAREMGPLPREWQDNLDRMAA
jgi:hypothetical protein